MGRQGLLQGWEKELKDSKLKIPFQPMSQHSLLYSGRFHTQQFSPPGTAALQEALGGFCWFPQRCSTSGAEALSVLLEHLYLCCSCVSPEKQ